MRDAARNVSKKVASQLKIRVPKTSMRVSEELPHHKDEHLRSPLLHHLAKKC